MGVNQMTLTIRGVLLRRTPTCASLTTAYRHSCGKNIAVR